MALTKILRNFVIRGSIIANRLNSLIAVKIQLWYNIACSINIHSNSSSVTSCMKLWPCSNAKYIQTEYIFYLSSSYGWYNEVTDLTFKSFFLSMFKLFDKLCTVYLYYQCVIFSLYSSSISSTAFLAIPLLLVHNTAHPDNVSSFNRWRLKRKYIKMLFTNIYWSFFSCEAFCVFILIHRNRIQMQT